MILEPAVTLTDYAIAVESAVLAALVSSEPRNPSRAWFILLFLSIAIAALLGGTVHGFMPDPAARMYTIVWGATLVSIGVVAVAAAMAAANSGWGQSVRRGVRATAIVVFVIYCGELLLVGQEYRLAIAVYLPAMLLLLLSFLTAYVSERRLEIAKRRRILLGAVGVLLTFVAAAIQRSRLTLAGLDHNAMYHVVQGIALVAIYLGALGLMRNRSAMD